MGPVTPFAQMPATPEPIIAQVRRQLADDPVLDMPLEPSLLDHVAERAVRELWESRVKTFVPVLALRQARALLHDQGIGIAADRWQVSGTGSTATAEPRQAERPRQDLLHLDADVLRLDDQGGQHR
jgi:hypothetical protein